MKARKTRTAKPENNITIISRQEIDDMRDKFKGQFDDLIIAFNDTCVQEINPNSIARKLYQQTDEVFLEKLEKNLEKIKKDK